jgi:hypothetical protein
MTVKVSNVRIMDIIPILARLSLQYDAVDIIVNEDTKTVQLIPIERMEIKPITVTLRDDNIDKFI